MGQTAKSTDPAPHGVRRNCFRLLRQQCIQLNKSSSCLSTRRCGIRTLQESQASSISILTRLRAGRPRNSDSIVNRGKTALLQSVQTGSGNNSSFLLSAHRASLRGGRAAGALISPFFPSSAEINLLAPEFGI
jgi:hypothetical protein